MQAFKPIFIVGVGRSGTSMLQSMLNAHKDITFPPETHFIRAYISKNIKLETVKEKLFVDESLLKLGVPLDEIYNKSTNINDFYLNILIYYMKKQNKKMVGDKDPKNIEYLHLIHSIFPYAIIVHIYRDPRAVISSRMIAKWSKDKPFWQHLLAYKAQLKYGRIIGRKKFNKYIEIQYEELIKNPVKELKILCSQIEVPFDINMIEFYKSAKEVVQGEELLWKQNVFSPVMLENIDKWRKALSSKEILIIEFFLIKEMSELGYKPTKSIPMTYKIKNIFNKLLLEFLAIVYMFKLN